MHFNSRGELVGRNALARAAELDNYPLSTTGRKLARLVQKVGWVERKRAPPENSLIPPGGPDSFAIGVPQAQEDAASRKKPLAVRRPDRQAIGATPLTYWHQIRAALSARRRTVAS